MTKEEIHEAIARDKARDGIQTTMYDAKLRDQRIGYDAGVRAATEYWLSRCPQIAWVMEAEMKGALGNE